MIAHRVAVNGNIYGADPCNGSLTVSPGQVQGGGQRFDSSSPDYATHSHAMGDYLKLRQEKA